MKYIVTKRLNGHGFEIGQIVRVKKFDDGYKAEAVGGETPPACYVQMSELEPLPMSELKKCWLWLIGFIIVCALLDCASANASGYEPYLKVGVGYKFSEQDEIQFCCDDRVYAIDNGSDYSARFEFGWERGNLSFGASHHSQWLAGWPFNDKWEYYKTELFIDYKWSL